MSEIPPRKRARLLKWTRRKKGTLRGFADAELPNGLQIFDCPLHVASDGRAWGGFPGKPQIDREGQPIRQDGRLQYVRILQWNSPELTKKWSEILVELVRQRDPEALQPDPQEIETAEPE